MSFYHSLSRPLCVLFSEGRGHSTKSTGIKPFSLLLQVLASGKIIFCKWPSNKVLCFLILLLVYPCTHPLAWSSGDFFFLHQAVFIAATNCLPDCTSLSDCTLHLYETKSADQTAPCICIRLHQLHQLHQTAPCICMRQSQLTRLHHASVSGYNNCTSCIRLHLAFVWDKVSWPDCTTQMCLEQDFKMQIRRCMGCTRLLYSMQKHQPALDRPTTIYVAASCSCTKLHHADAPVCIPLQRLRLMRAAGLLQGAYCKFPLTSCSLSTTCLSLAEILKK
jgi:hypothetical protein